MGKFIALDLFFFLLFMAVLAGLIALIFFSKKPKHSTPIDEECKPHKWGKWNLVFAETWQATQERKCSKCGYVERQELY